MDRRKPLSLRAVFCELRNHLLDVRDNRKNDPILRSLGYVFGTIEDLATEKGDGPTAKLAMRMYEAVRDTIEDEQWKSDIPTIEEIEATLPDDA